MCSCYEFANKARKRESVDMEARIAYVREDSIFYRKGLRDGDVIVRVNGHELKDIFEWRQELDLGWLEIEFFRAGSDEIRKIEIDFWSDGGMIDYSAIYFESPIFDGVRTCRNNCIFCFIKGLPRGLRKSLYIRDDDWRMSVFEGSYITFSNFTDEDWHRLEALAPLELYYSVHAISDDVRRAMGINAPSPLKVIERLRRMGIEVHTQIVVVPGFNDEDELKRSLDFLVKSRDVVKSIAVVPVGVTKYTPGEVKKPSRKQAEKILSYVESLSRDCLKEFATRLVWPSDEWYWIAYQRSWIKELPSYEFYEEFVQLENGVGKARKFIEEFKEAWREDGKPELKIDATILTTEMNKELFSEIFNGVVDGVRLKVVENSFFGLSVDVAPLLVGEDLFRAAGEEKGLCLFTEEALNEEGLFLDGLSIQDAPSNLVVAPAQGAEFYKFLRDLD